METTTKQKTAWGCFLSFFAFFIFVYAIASFSNKSGSGVNPAPIPSVEPKMARINWEYSESSIDPIDRSTTHYARCDATENVTFGSPYEGGSLPTLVVQKRHGSTSLILEMSTGQLLTSEGVMIKFDSGRAHSYSCSEPIDGSSNIMFIDEANALIKRLRHSKEVIVQATFFREGTRSMTFRTEGLKALL